MRVLVRTYAELHEPGPPVRVSDLMLITGWCRDTIIASIEAGDLRVIRRNYRAAYSIPRQSAISWLRQVGFDKVA